MCNGGTTDQIEKGIRGKHQVGAPYLTERTRRVGRAKVVSRSWRATGLTRDAVTAGLQELDAPRVVPLTRQRKVGAGRLWTPTSRENPVDAATKIREYRMRQPMLCVDGGRRLADQHRIRKMGLD